jgi:hypothetical protein
MGTNRADNTGARREPQGPQTIRKKDKRYSTKNGRKQQGKGEIHNREGKEMTKEHPVQTRRQEDGKKAASQNRRGKKGTERETRTETETETEMGAKRRLSAGAKGRKEWGKKGAGWEGGEKSDVEGSGPGVRGLVYQM